MNTKHPSMLDLLLETHIDLERQGPGSDEAIVQALEFLKPLERFSKIADLGCGTGGQTMLLAKYLPGTITGIDMFPDFIDKFNENSKMRNLGNRVTGIVGSMEDLAFQKNSLDLIWSEGAIDNIGFEKGLSHWHSFLKKGGFVAVTSPSWLTTERPVAVEQFWSDAGSRLDCIGNNIEIMQKCGYQFIAAFALSEQCWTENYFIPVKWRLIGYQKNIQMMKLCLTIPHKMNGKLNFIQSTVRIMGMCFILAEQYNFQFIIQLYRLTIQYSKGEHTMSDKIIFSPDSFFHGTKADLNMGDFLVTGMRKKYSNTRKISIHDGECSECQEKMK